MSCAHLATSTWSPPWPLQETTQPSGICIPQSTPSDCPQSAWSTPPPGLTARHPHHQRQSGQRPGCGASHRGHAEPLPLILFHPHVPPTLPRGWTVVGTGGCRTGQAGARRACVPSTLSPASHICMCELQRMAWGSGTQRLSQLRTRLASQTKPRPIPEDSTFCPGGTGQGLPWASQRWQNGVTSLRGGDPRPGWSCPQVLCDSAPSPPLAETCSVISAQNLLDWSFAPRVLG